MKKYFVLLVLPILLLSAPPVSAHADNVDVGGMMGSAMMTGASGFVWIFWLHMLLFWILAVLGIAALWKYLTKGKK